MTALRGSICGQHGTALPESDVNTAGYSPRRCTVLPSHAAQYKRINMEPAIFIKRSTAEMVASLYNSQPNVNNTRVTEHFVRGALIGFTVFVYYLGGGSTTVTEKDMDDAA